MQATSLDAAAYPLLARSDEGIDRLSADGHRAEAGLSQAIEMLRSGGLYASESSAFPGGIEGGTGVEELGGGWRGLGRAFFIIPSDGASFRASVTGPGNGSFEVPSGRLSDTVRAVVDEYTRRDGARELHR